MYVNNKLSFEGEFLDDGIKNGILYDKDGKIDGEIKENGERVIFNEFGDIIFEGEYLNGQRNGKGKEYNSNGILIFEGEYLNGKRNGKGKEYYDSLGLIFEGEFLNGRRNGKGIGYYKYGGILFEGEYIYGKVWNIKYYDGNGKILYELKNGKGIAKTYETVMLYLYTLKKNI